jgi:hypothetical protein
VIKGVTQETIFQRLRRETTQQEPAQQEAEG